MCEEKKIPQEINEDDLDKIAGGAFDANGDWLCAYCGKVFPAIKTNQACFVHWQKDCKDSPFYRG